MPRPTDLRIFSSSTPQLCVVSPTTQALCSKVSIGRSCPPPPFPFLCFCGFPRLRRLNCLWSRLWHRQRELNTSVFILGFSILGYIGYVIGETTDPCFPRFRSTDYSLSPVDRRKRKRERLSSMSPWDRDIDESLSLFLFRSTDYSPSPVDRTDYSLSPHPWGDRE